jgi:lambda family phage portal protein
MRGWDIRPNSAIDDVFFSVDTLRARSRDLYVSNPLAAAIISVLSTYTVGTGLRVMPKVQADILGISDDEADELNVKIAREFHIWADSPNCDFSRRLNFAQLQQLTIRSMLLSGDTPILLPYVSRPGVEYSLTVRLLEADRICNPMYYNWDRPIYAGVELTEAGEVTAYHVRQVHPFQGVLNAAITKHLFDWVRVPAYGELTGRPNVLLVAEFERPEQPRGVPILSKVIQILKDTDRFIKAEISSAEIAARFVFAVTSQFPNAEMFAQLSKSDKEELVKLSQYDVPISKENLAVFMKPGDSLNFLNSQRPSGTFDPFINSIAKSIGAAIEVPQEILLGKFDSSYTAARAAQLRFGKRIDVLRNILRTQMCQPIYSEFMAEAAARGTLDLPKYFETSRMRLAYEAAEWAGPTLGSLDPAKEIQASKDKVIQGHSTMEREALEINGTNYFGNLKQQGKEKRRAEAEGLPYPAVAEPAKVTQSFTDSGTDTEIGAEAEPDPTKEPPKESDPEAKR